MLTEVCPMYADNSTNILKRVKIQWVPEITNSVFRSKNIVFFIYTRQKVFDFFLYPNDIVLHVGIYTISSDL